MQFVTELNGVSWWYDEATEEIMPQFEDCIGG